MTFVIYLY